MPTGYTAEIGNGKPVTFANFAMNCARAFGALVSLRDDGSAPIPKKFEPSDHYRKKIVEAKKASGERA